MHESEWKIKSKNSRLEWVYDRGVSCHHCSFVFMNGIIGELDIHQDDVNMMNKGCSWRIGDSSYVDDTVLSF